MKTATITKFYIKDLLEYVENANGKELTSFGVKGTQEVMKQFTVAKNSLNKDYIYKISTEEGDYYVISLNQVADIVNNLANDEYKIISKT
jgi:hypothetical protein